MVQGSVQNNSPVPVAGVGVLVVATVTRGNENRRVYCETTLETPLAPKAAAEFACPMQQKDVLATGMADAFDEAVLSFEVRSTPRRPPPTRSSRRRTGKGPSGPSTRKPQPMSINGVLEDLPLADVLQFIHLGRRTGTLSCGATTSSAPRSASTTAASSAPGRPATASSATCWSKPACSSGGQVEAALDIQLRVEPPRSLGRILVDSGAVRRDQIHHVVREQVKTTVFDLVTWRQGHFHFEVDELDPPDDFSVEPDEVLGDLDLNTQMLLLEATRLFDEKNRAKKVDPESAARAELDRRLRRAGLSRTPLPGRTGRLGAPGHRAAAGPREGRPRRRRRREPAAGRGDPLPGAVGRRRPGRPSCAASCPTS